MPRIRPPNSLARWFSGPPVRAGLPEDLSREIDPTTLSIDASLDLNTGATQAGPHQHATRR